MSSPILYADKKHNQIVVLIQEEKQWQKVKIKYTKLENLFRNWPILIFVNIDFNTLKQRTCFYWCWWLTSATVVRLLRTHITNTTRTMAYQCYSFTLFKYNHNQHYTYIVLPVLQLYACKIHTLPTLQV